MSDRIFRLIPALAGLLLALAATNLAHASLLILSNGDRLTGHVTRRAGGKVYFHSDILGDIVAPENAVSVVEKPVPGPSPNSLAGLPPQRPAAATPGGANIVSAKTKVPVVLTPPVTPWTGKVEFGYNNVISGDIRTVALNLSGEAERTIQENDYLIKSRFLYGSTGGVPATDEEDADFRWRHNLSNLLFVQSETTYDSDKINLIHYEFEQNEGLGYKIYQSPRQTVDVGSGVTGEELDATGVAKGFTYLGNAFQDYVYKINGRYTFLEDTSAQYSPESRGLSGLVPGTVIPAVGNERDYAYKFHTTLQGKINEHLSLNLHFEYLYDNAVAVTSSRTQQRVTTTLGYGF